MDVTHFALMPWMPYLHICIDTGISYNPQGQGIIERAIDYQDNNYFKI